MALMALTFGPRWQRGMSVLLMLLLSTPAARCQPGHPASSGSNSSAVEVRTVHLVFSHHLDVGLDLLPGKIVADCVGFATKIVQRYFDEHIPRAIRYGRGRLRCPAVTSAFVQKNFSPATCQQPSQKPAPSPPP